MAARLSSYADTVDIAGIAFRLVSRNPKPGFWARDRPEFLTTRRPDVTVSITYDDNFRRRAGAPADEETVDDTPRVRRHGRSLLVTTGYYRATVDVRRGRAAVRIAGGFGVANMMRTLSALWLLERDTLLLRAPAGYVAATPRSDGTTMRLTPFVDPATPLPARGRARSALIAGDVSFKTAAGGARALATMLPAVWQADRRREAVVRTLELASLIVSAPAGRPRRSARRAARAADVRAAGRRGAGAPPAEPRLWITVVG
jgi:hypothetical protein